MECADQLTRAAAALGTAAVPARVSLLSNNATALLLGGCQGDGDPRSPRAGESCFVLAVTPDIRSPGTSSLLGTSTIVRRHDGRRRPEAIVHHTRPPARRSRRARRSWSCSGIWAISSSMGRAARGRQARHPRGTKRRRQSRGARRRRLRRKPGQESRGAQRPGISPRVSLNETPRRHGPSRTGASGSDSGLPPP